MDNVAKKGIPNLKKTQYEAIKQTMEFFAKNLNPICGHPPGEGKTRIGCVLIKEFIDKGKKKILVIAKSNNLKDPWKDELTGFGIPFTTIHGKDRKDDYLVGNRYETGNNIIVTSYDTALLDLKYLLNNDCYDLIIFDELHSIINPKKLTRKSIYLAQLKAKHRVALTATPIQNTIEDIGLMHLFLNRADFMAARIEGENLRENKDVVQAVTAAKNLGTLILPPELEKRSYTVHRILLSVPLTKEMENLMRQDATYRLIGNNIQKYFSFLSNPDSLYYSNSSYKANVRCSKLETVTMVIENTEPDEKVIIFSTFIDVLNSYYEHLTKKGYKAIIFTGKDRGREAERKKELFTKTNTFKILLTTTFKSAEGLNLDAATNVIILEFWWNPQRLIQAMGRIDRLSQKKDIFLYILCNNQNGKICDLEHFFLEVMEDKIEKARSFNPHQQDLPKLKAFIDESTFREEFLQYLKTFKPPHQKKVIVKRKLSLPPQISKSVEEKQPSLKEKLEEIYKADMKAKLEEEMAEELSKLFPPSDFSKLDLSS